MSFRHGLRTVLLATWCLSAAGTRCEPVATTRLLPDPQVRVAVLLGACVDGEESSRSAVEAFHDPENVYVVCAGRGHRAQLDDWIRQRGYSNVFVMAESAFFQGQHKDLRWEAARLLLDHPWDFLLELGDRPKAPQLPPLLLARWLAAFNSSIGGESFVLSRQLLEEVIEGPTISDLTVDQWHDFWAQGLSLGRCKAQHQGLQPLLQTKQPKRAAKEALSPVQAYDLGVKFRAMEPAWMSRYGNQTYWLLHALMVQSSQRLTELRRLAARPASGAAVSLRGAEMMAEVTFSPENGTCEVPGAVEGLRLSDCSIDAEVFLAERLFVADPFPERLIRESMDYEKSCGAKLPTLFPHVFRIGSGWDGDSLEFRGFASLVPADATDDLWMVLLPLLPADSGPCQKVGWTGRLQILWQSAAGEVHYRGGGQLASAGPIWERYLGSRLAPGTYTVTVLAAKVALARRDFEVISAEGAVAAERLKWVKFFELAAEAAPPAQSRPVERSEGSEGRAAPKEQEQRPKVQGLSKVEAQSEARTPPAQLPTAHKLSAKDRAWLQQDVARFARPRQAQQRQPPLSAEQRAMRERQWIERDVALHAPKRRPRPRSLATAAESPRSPRPSPPAKQATAVGDNPSRPKAKSTRPKLPEDMERRERAWMAKEAQRLRAARARAARTAEEREDWIVKDVQLHELLRRERCSQEPGKASRFLATTCQQLFGGGSADPETSADSPADLPQPRPTAPAPEHRPPRPASPATGNFSAVLAEVKLQLQGSIPDEVVERELPWILEDIAIGQKRFKKWAMVVMSRGETVSLPDRDNRSQTSPQLAIMPLIDLVDHHLPTPEKPLFSTDDLLKYQESGSLTNISYDAELAAVTLKAKRTLSANSAVTVGYGVRSNADYLLYHGFTMPKGWSEMTLCTQYTMVELPLPPDFPAWKSRHLAHSYRFALPACPSRKSTPHVAVGAARFLVATEDDVTNFEDKLAQDFSLLEGAQVARGEKFLQHAAQEAVSVVCDVKVQPPLCRVPLSVESERAAWDYILKQTLARVVRAPGC
ncbi:unnamed protein product [Effrenium voratum]|nr:unnamed protein product [Effrenium voratum]